MSQNVAMEILSQVCQQFNIPAHTKDDLSIFKDRAEGVSTEKPSTFYHEITTFPLQTSSKLFLEKIIEAQPSRFRGATRKIPAKKSTRKFLVKADVQLQDPNHLKNIPQVFRSWCNSGYQ